MSGPGTISLYPSGPAGSEMVSVSVMDQGALDRTCALLSGIQGGVSKVLRSAMKRAAKRLRQSSAQAAGERYAISNTAIRENEVSKISYVYYGQGVEASISFRGRRIPLYRFDGAGPVEPAYEPYFARAYVGGGWRMVHPGVQAKGHALRSTSPTALEDPETGYKAFTARMKSGHVGIFERTGAITSEGLSVIRELFGPSVPQMLGNPEVERKLLNDAMKGFGDDVDDEIVKILGRSGT